MNKERVKRRVQEKLDVTEDTIARTSSGFYLKVRDTSREENLRGNWQVTFGLGPRGGQKYLIGSYSDESRARDKAREVKQVLNLGR